MFQTFNHVKIGVHNRLLILNEIRLHPGIIRAEIARNCGLTSATVSNVVGKLLYMDYVQEMRAVEAKALENSTGKKQLGRPSQPLCINSQSLYTVGLSCDLSQIQGSIVDLNGNVVAFEEQELALGIEDPEAYIQGLQDLYQALCRQANLSGKKAPSAAGLAAMGPLNVAEGKIYLHSGHGAWQQYRFVDELQKAIGLPVILEKNSSAAALYELWNGTAKKLDSILYLYLGHGVGGAFILDNEMYRGAFANAGEIGHVNVVPNGKLCLCGQRGCLETELSLDALKQAVPAELWQGQGSMRQLFEQREPHLMAWLHNVAELLCRAVGTAIHLLDVNGVLLSGLLPEPVLGFFVDYLQQNIHLHIMHGKSNALTFELSRQDNQPSLGAALLPICESLNSGLRKSGQGDNLFSY